MNKKQKRILIASFFFDLKEAQNHMYMPTVSVYWDLVNKDKPFQMTVKYAWQDFTVNYPYKLTMNYLRGKRFLDLAKSEITERIPDYKGKFATSEDEYYLSGAGKSILASKTQKQVEEWINSNTLSPLI